MKLIDAINRVDKSKENTAGWVNFDAFIEALNISVYYTCDDRWEQCVKGYHLIKWYCTDTWVGVVVIYLNDVPVAITEQSARKDDVKVKFVSSDAATMMREFILSLNEDRNNFSVIDPNEEVDEFYTVDFGSQLLVSKGFYNGKEVSVVKTYDTYNNIDKWRYIVVRNSDKVFEIPVSEFKIPIAIR